jgi:hypothetical protein
MAVNLVTKIIEMLKLAGIDYSKMAGKIDPNKVKQLVTKTQTTATKPKLINALVDQKKTFGDALKIFEDEARYISQMNEMELANFANNLQDYFKVGGKKKNIPSNVVTTEGTPVEGKKLETLAKRKGADVGSDSSLQGGLKGLMTLVDEIKGITPKMRNTMDRNELAAFIQKMRGRKFTNEEIKWVREYLDDDYSLSFAKEKATGMQYGKKLGAKSKEEFEFVTEYVDNLNSYSPKEFKEMYGTVKNINMDISSMIDKKLEKHFKKKYKWDDTKKDGGLDDKTYEMYEDELYQTQKDFGDFHTMYDTNQRPNIFGFRKGTSWANHPNNYLDEASEKFESITGQGLNVDFLKNYTDDVLTKYVDPEKFQYGGPVLKGPDMGSTAHGSSELASRQRVLQPGGQMTTSTGLNYLLGEDDNNRIPFNDGLLVPKPKPSESYRILEMLDKNKKAAFNTLGAETMFNLIYEHAPKAFEKGEISEEDYNEAMKAFKPKGIAALKKIKAEKEAYLDKYADGGRIGFAGGGMGRRGFLKLLGGTAAGIAAMKAGLVKLLSGPTTKKSIAKGITIPKTGGMPDWFEPLVNKVIREGEDVTKQFATKEREIVYSKNLETNPKLKDASGADEVVVYQDLDDGAIKVEYHSADNLAEGPVELKFTPGMADETTKGKPPDEFTASEAEPEIVNWDGDIEFTGENLVDDVGGLTSDTTKLKEYAVGKDKVTVNEIVESIKKKKRTQKINEDPMEQINYIEEKHGPAMDDVDYIDEIEKKAFGGRIGFSGGMAVKKLIEIANRIGLDFNQATDVQKQIIQKYGDRIHDKLLDYIVYDPNAQRQAEVMASIDEAEIMMNKGMSPDDVIAAQKKSFRTKNALGGRAGFFEGGIGTELTKKQLEEMLNVKKPKNYRESPFAIPDDWLKTLKEKLIKKQASGGLAGMLGE